MFNLLFTVSLFTCQICNKAISFGVYRQLLQEYPLNNASELRIVLSTKSKPFKSCSFTTDTDIWVQPLAISLAPDHLKINRKNINKRINFMPLYHHIWRVSEKSLPHTDWWPVWFFSILHSVPSSFHLWREREQVWLLLHSLRFQNIFLTCHHTWSAHS